jgi:hypothetical protein
MCDIPSILLLLLLLLLEEEEEEEEEEIVVVVVHHYYHRHNPVPQTLVHTMTIYMHYFLNFKLPVRIQNGICGDTPVRPYLSELSSV